MFGTKDQSEVVEVTASDTAASVTQSHVADGMLVTGDISGDIDLLLDGRLEGNLRCRNVRVGKSGVIIGKITAKTTVIEGRIEGDIDSQKVVLTNSAEMLGNVHHEVIEVAAGARIEGHYTRHDGKPVVPGKTSNVMGRGAAPPRASASASPLKPGEAYSAAGGVRAVSADGGRKPPEH